MGAYPSVGLLVFKIHSFIRQIPSDLQGRRGKGWWAITAPAVQNCRRLDRAFYVTKRECGLVSLVLARPHLALYFGKSALARKC